MSKRKPARTIKARSASKIRSKAAGSGQPKGRANSKQARVLALLCGPSGATIAIVTRSTGWQPHTVRALPDCVVGLGGFEPPTRALSAVGSTVELRARPPEKIPLEPGLFCTRLRLQTEHA